MITTSTLWKNLSQISALETIMVARLYYGDGTSYYSIAEAELPPEISPGGEKFIGIIENGETASYQISTDLWTRMPSVSDIVLQLSNLKIQPNFRFSSVLETAGAGADLGFERRRVDIRLWKEGITAWADCFPLMPNGLTIKTPHDANTIQWHVEDAGPRLLNAELGRITNSDAAAGEGGVVPQVDSGKVKPWIYGDHRYFYMQGTKSTITYDNRHNMTPCRYLGRDANGDHQWLVSAHELTDISGDGMGIWGYDKAIGRFVQLSNFTIEQGENDGSECIISHPAEQVMWDYQLPDGGTDNLVEDAVGDTAEITNEGNGGDHDEDTSAVFQAVVASGGSPRCSVGYTFPPYENDQRIIECAVFAIADYDETVASATEFNINFIDQRDNADGSTIIQCGTLNNAEVDLNDDPDVGWNVGDFDTFEHDIFSITRAVSGAVGDHCYVALVASLLGTNSHVRISFFVTENAGDVGDVNFRIASDTALTADLSVNETITTGWNYIEVRGNANFGSAAYMGFYDTTGGTPKVDFAVNSFRAVRVSGPDEELTVNLETDGTNGTFTGTLYEVWKRVAYIPDGMLPLFAACQGYPYQTWINGRSTGDTNPETGAAYPETHQDDDEQQDNDPSVIENIAGVMESIPRDINGAGDSEVDEDSLNILSNDQTSIDVSLALLDQPNWTELLSHLAKHARAFWWFSPEGKLKARAMETTYSTSDLDLPSDAFITLETGLIEDRYFYPRIQMLYLWDGEKFQKAGSISSNSTCITRYNGALASGAAPLNVIESKIIRVDSDVVEVTAPEQKFYQQPLMLMRGVLPQPFLDLDIGDTLALTDLGDNDEYKPRGLDITADVTVAGQTLYEQFFIHRAKRTKYTNEVVAFQTRALV